MNTIIEKLHDLERKISEDKGQFSLFALFLREDAQDKWDLLAAAPWIEHNKKDSLNYLVNRLRTTLTPDELLSLSRIVFVDDGTPSLDALHKAISIEHGTAEVENSNFLGLEIKHAYIFTSKRQNVSAASQSP